MKNDEVTKIKEFCKAATIRAFRTFCQSLLSLLTVGIGIFNLDWKEIISLSLTTTLISILNAIVTGLPEIGSDGAFIIDNSDPDKSKWTLEYDGDPEELKDGDSVKFEVHEEINGGQL